MYRETDSGILKFSPSDLTVFLETEFGSWMDRWQVERSHGNHEAVGANGLPICGVPSVIGRPDSPEAVAFRHVAQAAAERITELEPEPA